ncbi:MAG: 2-oxoglutarate oxidoreductase subunit KorB [Candidatus Heimdallarchaeota archaeon LC_2]|nr:MAG: 2-oxoglutarate oxidoreductase subunit KorB [Candidatus Heimdallarchaeota archaeon LC_2]
MVSSDNLIQLKYDKKGYTNKSYHPLWCPGCGDFAILSSLKNALFEMQIEPSQTILVPGIGCSSKMMSAIDVYGFHGIHGRALPIATGIKVANHKLNVIAFGGDGDMLGIGGNHFIHTCRRNVNLTLILPNNHVYGLTTGQTSPTSDIGYKTKTSPGGNVDQPLRTPSLALAAKATFVARTSSAKKEHLQKMIEAAIKHKGIAVVEVLQFCITFNRINTPDYFEPRLYDLQDTDHDTSNYEEAIRLADQWGDKIPYGIFYQTRKPIYEDVYDQLKDKSLVEKRPRQARDVSKLFKEQR